MPKTSPTPETIDYFYERLLVSAAQHPNGVASFISYGFMREVAAGIAASHDPSVDDKHLGRALIRWELEHPEHFRTHEGHQARLKLIVAGTPLEQALKL